jgi:serine/threonine-protein phosphatase PP1 catalytic subunit
MSVSEDLLCSFELLKPLDGAALKKEMTKSKRKSCVATGTSIDLQLHHFGDSNPFHDLARHADWTSRRLQNHQSPPNNPMAQSF